MKVSAYQMTTLVLALWFHFCRQILIFLFSLIRFDNGHKSLQNLIDFGIGSSNMSNAVLDV